MSEVVRMMTPICPVMDNAYLDTYFFFVPNRLIWDNFKRFMGENDTAPWTQTTEYEVPQIVAPEAGWKKGSLADYFGYPTEIGGYKASALPFRGYVKIWNDWFRDQNLKNPCYLTTGDADIQGTDKTTLGNSYDYVVDTEKGAAPCKVAKFHDYFTSCLPQAQKGNPVYVPLGDRAPLVYGQLGTGTDGANTGKKVLGENYIASYTQGTPTIGVWKTPTGDATKDGAYSIEADLSQALGATVNELRAAFQIQKYYEKDALYGTRYIESVRAHFGVVNPDFRVQRSEYLGGKRIPLNMNQVIQTDSSGKSSYYDSITNKWITENKTPQGNTAAYSVTSDVNEDLFSHSFTEHGWIIGLCCVRTDHSYQQGLNRMFSRKKKFDFYTPEFANLGNTDVKVKEIYLQNTEDDEKAFGYQEAWADYRFQPSIVTSSMRSNYAQSLDIWHYADDYASKPSLGTDWIDEPEDNMARTLAVQDEDQLFGDFYFGAIWTRPMPMYSIPGLIDHH